MSVSQSVTNKIKTTYSQPISCTGEIPLDTKFMIFLTARRYFLLNIMCLFKSN